MKLTDSLAVWLKEAASNLEGSARRRFMAGAVRELGRGGQWRAAQKLGWNRSTIRKGERELRDGIEIPDGRKNNGQPSLEELMPNLRSDLRDVLDPSTQADPSLRSERLYRQLTIKEVIRRLVAEKGYSEEDLPSEESIRVRVNDLGYFPSSVRKTLPQKRSPRQMPSSSASKW
jgi:hypothetical protein